MNNKLKLVAAFLVFALLGGVFGGIGGFVFSYWRTTAAISAGENPFGIGDSIESWLEKTKSDLENFGLNRPSEFSSHEAAVISAVEKAAPAVVSIVISKDVPVVEKYYSNPFDNLPPEFQQFFGNFGLQIPQEKQSGTEKLEVGGGTGFIISSDGIVITNKHVVSDADAEYSVFLSDGKKYEAKVLAQDSFNDLALLKIETDNLPVLELADSDNIKIGQTAIAIGYALAEFRNTVSVGVVSGLSRSISTSEDFGGSVEELEDVIQTDAAINFGNSGGPLLDSGGRVIGINVAKAASAQNIGFALPSNLVKRALESYKKFGKIASPYIGIWYQPVNEQVAEENNLGRDYGVWLKRSDSVGGSAVVAGSPAEKAGLQDEDIILEMDDQKIDENRSLTSILRKHNPGDAVNLKIWRSGRELSLSVVLAEKPEGI